MISASTPSPSAPDSRHPVAILLRAEFLALGSGSYRATGTPWAAKTWAKVHLALGANNALLVLPNADLDAAASAGAWGSFLHQGQICMTTGRHLVHRSQVAEYAAKLAEKAAALPVGDPTDRSNALGPIIDERQRDKVHDIVTSSVEQGAVVAACGTYGGLFYRPTVLTDVPMDAPAFAEEIFGPVAPVVAYDAIDEAIELINSSEYGLSVSILTANAFTAWELADRIESGAIHINEHLFRGAVAHGAVEHRALPLLTWPPTRWRPCCWCPGSPNRRSVRPPWLLEPEIMGPWALLPPAPDAFTGGRNRPTTEALRCAAGRPSLCSACRTR
ncbi:aldehyde dehydrogenase family protein [Streptomyces sp. SDT5-1]|uniref:aldehyde dehydrogenase family protein n=1 Tax=Streptomyces sp. SDT5-1 TaxID=3406418 RepID=UPI003FD24CC0